MGIGCPECDKKLSEETVINRMLACVGDGQYELTESSEDGKRKVLHLTCGRVRDQHVQQIIYEEKECICSRLVTIESLQNRIDPTEKEFTVLGFEKKIQEVTLRHKGCGRCFRIALARFERLPYCRCCHPKSYSNEQFQKEIKNLTGDAYEVTVPFTSQKEKVELRHKACGTTTAGFAWEFVRGKRCDLCTPIISEEIVIQALKEGTGSKCQLIGRDRDLLMIRMENGEIKKKKSRYVIQELTRPTPSDFFPNREKVMLELISAKGKLFLEIKETCERNGVWFLSDKKKEENDRGIIKNYLQRMLKAGYIHSKRNGIYSVSIGIEDSVVIEQKYVHHGDEVLGAWYGESLAYRCGILEEKPVVESVLINKQKVQRWLNTRVGDTEVCKMKPSVLVTKENETLMNVVNLLAYASEHPEYEEKVLKYLETKNISLERILKSDVFRKSAKRVQKYISDVFPKVNDHS